MPNVTLDQLVVFDATGWRRKAVSDPSVAVWNPPEGGGVGLYYQAQPPDIPLAETRAELRRLERLALRGQGTGLIEHNVVFAGGGTAVHRITKMATDPTIQLARSGMTYVASLTFPFQRMSLEVRIQARESGPTGTREAAVLTRAMRDGRVTPAPPGGVIGGWFPIPADGLGPLDATLAESVEFDEEFPKHPLSRVRTLLRRVESTVHLDPILKSEVPFPLPSA